MDIDVTDKATDELVQRCRRYLARQKVVLWAQSWSVQEERELEEAAVWLAETIRDVAALEEGK